MKKQIYAIAIAAVMIMAGCSKDSTSSGSNGTGGNNETADQNVAAVYFGGTWCGPCGAYGKPMKEAMEAKYGDKFAFISCQVSGSSTDPMNVADANTLAGTFNVTGVPALFMGANEGPFISFVGGSSSLTSQVGSLVDSMTTKINPIMYINSASATYDSVANNLIMVNTSVKYNQDDVEDGELFMAGYLVESGLKYTQYMDGSTTQKNIHNMVLRCKLSETVTGSSIATTLGKKGQTVTRVLGSAIPTTIKPAPVINNCKVVLMVFKKKSTGLVPVNAKVIPITRVVH